MNCMDSSESLTPPGSPVFGYSGLKSSSSRSAVAAGGIVDNLEDDFFENEPEIPVYQFTCKGPILARNLDNSFSSNGLFLRNQAISTINLLKRGANNNNDGHLLLGLFSATPLFDKFDSPPQPPQDGEESHRLERRNCTTFTILGHKFNPYQEEQFWIIMKMVQKKIFTLMNLARPNFSTTTSSSAAGGAAFSRNSYYNNNANANSNNYNPYQLRHTICELFNLLIAQRGEPTSTWFYTNNENMHVMNDERVHQLFNGLKKCLGSVPTTWSSTLKFHCGSKEGNQCTSPDFHLFHLHLELRWSLLVLTGFNVSLLNWVIQDLIELSYLKFQSSSSHHHSGSGSGSSGLLEAVSPFNCFCVKELWALLRAVLDHVAPVAVGKFWNVVISNLSTKCRSNSRSTSSSSSVESNYLLFPLWFLSHLVTVYDYELNGIHSPWTKAKAQEFQEDMAHTASNSSTSSSTACCYSFVNQVIKKWLQQPRSSSSGGGGGGKIKELIHYTRRFIPYWGFDLEIYTMLWTHMLPKLDRGCQMDSMRLYSSPLKWFQLISLHIGRDGLKEVSASASASASRPSSSENDVLASDSFLEFLHLIHTQIKLCNNVKDWRKLKSCLCNRVTAKNVGALNEFGLARLATLFLTLAYGSDDTLAMCERLNETLDYTKELFLNTKLRAKCTMILLLLSKSINITTTCTSLCTDLMKTIDEMIITSSRTSAHKEPVMIYIENLEHLPNCSPHTDLGQSKLIPSNLTVWLTTSGDNYVGRTLQTLHKLFEQWIFADTSQTQSFASASASGGGATNEKTAVSELIEKKVLQFLKQSVSTPQFCLDFDLKPYADLAADFTIIHGLLQHLYMNAEMVGKLFEFFAVHERTCPAVSERYVSQLINRPTATTKLWSWNGIISDSLLAQAWIRLLFFHYDVPLQLSVHVLSLHNELTFPAITSEPESLLLQFCQIVNSCGCSCSGSSGKETTTTTTSQFWSKSQLMNLLGPTLASLKIIVANSPSTQSSTVTTTNPQLQQQAPTPPTTSKASQDENRHRIKSYLKSCSVILRQIFDKIYVRNSQNCVQQILDALCPPFVGKLPWEKLPGDVVGMLRGYLPEFFISIVSYGPWKQDPYLKRKLSDIIRFALLGYSNADELDSTNPGLLIAQYCESSQPNSDLLQELSSAFQNHVTKDVQLTKKYLLTVLGFLKRHMIPTVLALSGPVLEILVEKEIEYTSVCTNILSHLSATLELGRVPNSTNLKGTLLKTIDSILLKHFAFRSKKFFDLFTSFVTPSLNSNSRTLPLLKKFVKFDIVPLIENYIQLSEAKQGSGTNYTLRRQLEELEKRLTDVV